MKSSVLTSVISGGCVKFDAASFVFLFVPYGDVDTYNVGGAGGDDSLRSLSSWLLSDASTGRA